MVAYKKMNRYAVVGKSGQLGQQPHITFRYYILVFVPEVKQVAYNKQHRSLFFYFIEETDDSLFAFAALLLVGCSQVKIGQEEYFFAGRNLHVTKLAGYRQLKKGKLPWAHARPLPAFSQYRPCGWGRWPV